jgi:hypothetical protein
MHKKKTPLPHRNVHRTDTVRQHACLVTSQTCPHSPSSFVRTARIPPSPTGRTQSSSLALPAATTAAGRAPRYLPALTATAAGGHPTRENDTREGAAVFSSIWSGLANDLRPRHGRPDGVPLAGVAAVRSVCCGVGGPTGDFFFGSWRWREGFPPLPLGGFRQVLLRVRTSGNGVLERYRTTLNGNN